MSRFPSVNTFEDIAAERLHVRNVCLPSKKVAQPLIFLEIFGAQKRYGIRWNWQNVSFNLIPMQHVTVYKMGWILRAKT